MPFTIGTESSPRVVFAIYEPPSPGLPWLAVCLNFGGEIITSIPCGTREEAQAETARCVAEFVKRLEAGKRLN